MLFLEFTRFYGWNDTGKNISKMGEIVRINSIWNIAINAYCSSAIFKVIHCS